MVIPASEADAPGATPGWPEIRSFAIAAEQRGLDSLWMYDHFYYDPEDGRPIEGTQEAWTVMSAVAAVTERVRIGALVLCSSFRDPGLLAKMAVTLDEVSGGRLILGLGAGWHDPEYDAFGIPKDHRVARFEEDLRIIVPLLGGQRVSFEGTYRRARGALLVPAPSRRIPILIAAEGPRMLGLTARFADEWNTAWYGGPDERLRASFGALDQALASAGREPASVSRTVGVTLREPGAPEDGEPALSGSPEELARSFDEYEALGADHVILALEPATEESLDRVAEALRLRVA